MHFLFFKFWFIFWNSDRNIDFYSDAEWQLTIQQFLLIREHSIFSDYFPAFDSKEKYKVINALLCTYSRSKLTINVFYLWSWLYNSSSSSSLQKRWSIPFEHQLKVFQYNTKYIEHWFPTIQKDENRLRRNVTQIPKTKNIFLKNYFQFSQSYYMNEQNIHSVCVALDVSCLNIIVWFSVQCGIGKYTNTFNALVEMINRRTFNCYSDEC